MADNQDALATGDAGDQHAVVANDVNSVVENGEASSGLSDTGHVNDSADAGVQRTPSDIVPFELTPEYVVKPDQSEGSVAVQINRKHSARNTLTVAAIMFISVLLITVVVASYQPRSKQVRVMEDTSGKLADNDTFKEVLEDIQRRQGAIQREPGKVSPAAYGEQQSSGREVLQGLDATSLPTQEATGDHEPVMNQRELEEQKSPAETGQQPIDQEQREAELRQLIEIETAR